MPYDPAAVAAVMTSDSATAIVAYCETQIYALGRTFDACAHWSYPVKPPDPQGRYSLSVIIVKPFAWFFQLHYTGEQILGYSTGTTTADIQHQIHAEIDKALSGREL
jgi:hypothetical protein